MNMDMLIKIIIGIIALLVVSLIALVTISIANSKKQKKKREEEYDNMYKRNPNDDLNKIQASNDKKDEDKKKTESTKKSDMKDITADYVQNFIEFDEIIDNMIVQNKGDKYIMVIKCQGINYDLMSEAEMISVEEGFIQFLNTLRFPIQLYVQTSSLDLTESLAEYNARVDNVADEIDKMRNNLKEQQANDDEDFEKINKIKYELRKKMNIYEYGRDIVNNVEKISKNKNILQQNYYVIVPYYITELGPNSFNPHELKEMAFQELYTRCRGLISSLAICSVNSKILNSFEIAELLYLAYNRDEGEIYTFRNAIEAEYDKLYHTAPDVLDKKMEQFDAEIQETAASKANEEIIKASGNIPGDILENNAMIEKLVYENSKKYVKDYDGLIDNKILKTAVENINTEYKSNKKKSKEEAFEKNKKTDDEKLDNELDKLLREKEQRQQKNESDEEGGNQ